MYGKLVEQIADMYGKPMHNLWKIYGQLVDMYGYLWKICGTFLDMYGKSMANLWKIPRYVWKINGKLIDMYGTYGKPMEETCLKKIIF